MVSKQISDDIKQFSYEICKKNKIVIRYMETDKDHIHYMIETEPTMSVSKKSISGRNILSGQMDILLVAQETFRKKHSVNT